ncbi:MAG: hypothetical protein NXI00_24200, partial [Cytophagales bacterium]|nr:hypothetical protein [Cytophagales bacterium]
MKLCDYKEHNQLGKETLVGKYICKSLSVSKHLFCKPDMRRNEKNTLPSLIQRNETNFSFPNAIAPIKPPGQNGNLQLGKRQRTEDNSLQRGEELPSIQAPKISRTSTDSQDAKLSPLSNSSDKQKNSEIPMSPSSEMRVDSTSEQNTSNNDESSLYVLQLLIYVLMYSCYHNVELQFSSG